jgi:hypothetical protein
VLEVFEQLVIMILSAVAIALVTGVGGSWVKWGCISGLVAQPLWFHTGLVNHQLALMCMSGFYGLSYAKGLWREWKK